MDIVYPLGKGTTWDNNEIRYSLRSVEKFLSGVENVWVVGEKPSWLKNVIHLPFPDITGVPWRNTMAKLLHVCKQADLSDEFLYMNDDFFLHDYFDIETFPYLYRGNLPAGRRVSRLAALNRKENTTEILKQMRITTLDYDMHAPFRFQKEKVLRLPITEKMPGAFHPRSLYGNLYNVRGIQSHENLVWPRRSLVELEGELFEKQFFAITSNAGADWVVRKYIQNEYPVPSKYE
jgi:hypothetical protein